MEIINLYKYNREEGKVTVSPIKPDKEYTELYRLIADEGKILVNGDMVERCIDVYSVDGWQEIDNQTE